MGKQAKAGKMILTINPRALNARGHVARCSRAAEWLLDTVFHSFLSSTSSASRLGSSTRGFSILLRYRVNEFNLFNYGIFALFKEARTGMDVMSSLLD